MEFSNRNILITGAADGLGFAVSKAFSEKRTQSEDHDSKTSFNFQNRFGFHEILDNENTMIASKEMPRKRRATRQNKRMRRKRVEK